MLDKETIKSITITVVDYINESTSRFLAVKRINSTLHRKTVKTVFSELNQLSAQLRGQSKSNAVLMVVLALLCRDPECSNKIGYYIQKYNMTGCLYGGFYRLLCSQSIAVSLTIKWADEKYKNKLVFINSLNYYDCFRNLTILDQAAEIVQLINQSKYERLVIEDKSNILALSMARRIDVSPSDNLIRGLLLSENELKQNIGLFFISDKVDFAINKLSEFEGISNKTTNNNEHKKLRNEFSTAVETFINFLEQCDNETQASLLINYLLVYKKYPNVFALKLNGSILQPYFILQIRNSGKIKSFMDLDCITQIISKNPATNENNKRISKRDLYMAVTDAFIKLLDDRITFDYNEQIVENICSNLPVKCIRKLKVYLIKKRKELMCEEIDRLVRFKIYLKDSGFGEIIDKTLTIVLNTI